jgi:hypothetical protein
LQCRFSSCQRFQHSVSLQDKTRRRSHDRSQQAAKKMRQKHAPYARFAIIAF